MAETANSIELAISLPRITAPVLERLVSAAATQAAMPVDRLVNALAAVDALVAAAASVLPEDEPRRFAVTVGEGRIDLAIEALQDGQAEAVIEATRLPAVGAVLERIATDVKAHRGARGGSLVMTLD